jgi:hypothetical protein
MSITRKKSKWWSAADIRKIKAIIKEAEDQGFGRSVGLNYAAEHFGVTRNAIVIKLGRLEKGIKSNHLNRPTSKVPIVRKEKVDHSPVVDEPKSNKIIIPVELLINTTAKVKKVIIDFDNRSIAYTY